MNRIKRTDDATYEVIGFEVRGAITSDVDDRFGLLPRLRDPHTGEIHYGFNRVDEVGVTQFTLREIFAMGFTTDEYVAMIRFEAASSFEDHVRSEDELNALMDSQAAWKRRPADPDVTRPVSSARASAVEPLVAENEEIATRFGR
ncbi:hypothetical protein AB4Z25_24890 [Rhizobium sp. RAF36]|uniref:hypothetical protein n=1 Tax=Rhizobium sp. RAF36 TaxID=3233055 RepID=UPI003F98F3D1